LTRASRIASLSTARASSSRPAAASARPCSVENHGRLVIAGVAAAILVIGQMTGRYDTALIGLGLGAAESTLRPAYHRRLVEKIRQIGH